MKIDRITYQKIFPTGMMYLNHKIGIEIQLDSDDSPDEAFEVAKKTVEQWNLESNPGMATAMEYMKHEVPVLGTKQVEKDSKESATQRIIDQINQCPDIVVLESFKLIAKSNPEIQIAYDNKLKTFK